MLLQPKKEFRLGAWGVSGEASFAAIDAQLQ